VAVVANSNGSLGTVGISGNEAMGRILAGGVRDMADWVNKLYGQAFAAVYVQPAPGSPCTWSSRSTSTTTPRGVGSTTAPEKPMRRIWIDAAACCWRSPCWAAAPPARRSCCPTATAPCSTSGIRRPAAARGNRRRAGRPATARCAPGPAPAAEPIDAQAAPACRRAYTRTAQNEIHRQFRRLPNPDLVMYVFPHLAGTDPVPVPGYSTVFPLYQRVQYAMPGERVEDY
jgi:conjugative transfer region lipoprotein (TIGR03751 family)